MIRSLKLGGLALALTLFLTGVSAAVVPSPPPVLSSTSPANGASVQSAATVSATYDQALHASSTLVVKDASNVAVAGTTGFSPDTATIVFTPASALAPGGGPYGATATARNATNDNQVVSAWTFSVDTTAPAQPTITSVDGDST